VSAGAVQKLRSGWPFAGVLLTIAVGLAAAGVGAAVMVGMLSVLVFGPAYLIQNSIRRRRGTLPVPPPKTPAEKARSDARFMRASVVALLAYAVGALVVVAVGRGGWLPGRGWTAVLLLGAAFGISGAPHMWAIAELLARQRMLRWAWAASAVLDLAFGTAATIIAITNERDHWIGSSIWTVALGALALMWLIGVPGALVRARGR